MKDELGYDEIQGKPRTTSAQMDAAFLHERVKELEAEVERLKERLESLTKQRDMYLADRTKYIAKLAAHEGAIQDWIKILEESPENVLYVIEGMRDRLEGK